MLSLMARICSVLKVVRHRCAPGRERYRADFPEHLKKVFMDLLGGTLPGMVSPLAVHQCQRWVGKSKVIKHPISGVQIKCLNVGERTPGKGNVTAKCRQYFFTADIRNFSQQI